MEIKNPTLIPTPVYHAVTAPNLWFLCSVDSAVTA